MSLVFSRWAGAPARFPRVSGDEPVWLVLRQTRGEFSPRERG